MKFIKNNLNNYFDLSTFYQFDTIYKNLTSMINKQKKITYKNNRLLAIYDFADLPYTHDFGVFLLNAEIERRHFDLKKIDIVIVTNDEYPANEEYQPNINSNNYKQFIHNINMELTKLLNTIGSTFIFDNRNQVIDFLKAMKKNYHSTFPNDYNPNLPFERIPKQNILSYSSTNYIPFAKDDISINCLTPTKYQLNLANKWLRKFVKGRIPVTITLREWKEVQPERSSKIDEWQKVIDYYNVYNSNVLFIILRDYYCLYDENNLKGDNIIYCNEAVLSLSFRAALYQEATLNMFVTNGVAVTAWHNYNVNYIDFKHLLKNTGSVSEDYYKNFLNIEFNEQWYGASKYQKLVWNKEEYSHIKHELSLMIEKLTNDDQLLKYMKEDNVVAEYSYDKNIYSKKSQRSKRYKISQYLFLYKLIKIKRNFLSFFSFNRYSYLEKTRIGNDTKILIYGAGTRAINIFPQIKGNVIGVVDLNAFNKKFINNMQIENIEKILDYNYDYILITPHKREELIMETLQNKFKIPKKKFLIIEKD
jgi:hypothetical protein